ncbi:MAG: DUF935 domain-containing protein [Syntrophobacteraceae bacterium]
MAEASNRPWTEEVATVEKDIDLFSGWTTRLENPDEVLRLESGGRGVKLYEELERDWQVFSMLQTRALAVQACEWQVEAASDNAEDAKIADFVREALQAANFDRMTTDLMQAALCGYKPVEVMWEVSSGAAWISEFRGRRPSRFVFDRDGALRLLTLQNIYEGEPVPERKFIVWSHGGSSHNPYGLGLGYQLYWPVWFKKNAVRFWMVFAEKFGSPTLLGKYPAGTSGKDKDSLLDAMRAIRQQTGIRIPDTMQLGLLEAQRTTSVNVYDGLCDYMDRAIAKIILGQTLTSESGESGSYSLGQVHNDVRMDIVKADADGMCEALNGSVVRWIVDFNYPPPSGGRMKYPRVWRRTEPERDLKALAERDKIILVDMDFKRRVPESYIADTYGIPLAAEGEATIADAAGGGAEAAPKNAEFTEPATAGGLGQDWLDEMRSGATAAADAELQRMLDPVLTLVRDAKSLEEIGEKIFGLYPALDADRFQELLARAMFAAGLSGYGASQAEASHE